MQKYFLNSIDIFASIKDKTSLYKYNSLTYSEFEDCEKGEVYECDKAIFIVCHKKDYYQIEWMTNEKENLINLTDNFPKPFVIKFIPKEWANSLIHNGFNEFGFLHSYWIKDLTNTFVPNIKVQLLNKEDYQKAAQITRLCYFQSREFEGETDEWTLKWLNNDTNDGVRNGTILAEYINNEPVAVAFVGVYGQMEKTTLWLRELACHPDYQNRGLGTKLVNEALNYGKMLNAKRAFLMADELNKNADKLYRKAGFVPDLDDYQIDLIKNN